MGRREAFTLVELLVVISIISILSSLILPTLSGAGEKARRVACINNLRQLGNGLQVYSQDYNGRFPVTQAVNPQPDAMACLGLLYERYVGDNEVFVGQHVKWCPFSTRGVKDDDIFARGTGGRTDSWVRK